MKEELTILWQWIDGTRTLAAYWIAHATEHTEGVFLHVARLEELPGEEYTIEVEGVRLYRWHLHILGSARLGPIELHTRKADPPKQFASRLVVQHSPLMASARRKLRLVGA